jgi:hypothetical protein
VRFPAKEEYGEVPGTNGPSFVTLVMLPVDTSLITLTSQNEIFGWHIVIDPLGAGEYVKAQ